MPLFSCVDAFEAGSDEPAVGGASGQAGAAFGGSTQAGASGHGGSTAGDESMGGGPSAGGAPEGGTPITAGASGEDTSGNGGTSGSGAGRANGGGGISGSLGLGGLAGKVGSAGTGGSGGDVDIPTEGLVYWFSADHGITQSSDGISRWADRSGHASDAVQLASSARPALGTLGDSQLPAIEFGDAKYLSLPPFTADTAEGVSFFAVARPTEGGESCMPLLEVSNGGEIHDISFDWLEGSAFNYEVVDENVIGQMDAFPLDETRLVGVTHSSDGIVSLFTNGFASGADNFAIPETIVRNQAFIGRSLYAGCDHLHGSIAEIILYARGLTNDERVSIEQYLRAKWQCCGT